EREGYAIADQRSNGSADKHDEEHEARNERDTAAFIRSDQFKHEVM
ncbi:MAG: hypothetical protein ACI9DE_001437, partial [Halioglobus sp.]